MKAENSITKTSMQMGMRATPNELKKTDRFFPEPKFTSIHLVHELGPKPCHEHLILPCFVSNRNIPAFTNEQAFCRLLPPLLNALERIQPGSLQDFSEKMPSIKHYGHSSKSNKPLPTDLIQNILQLDNQSILNYKIACLANLTRSKRQEIIDNFARKVGFSSSLTGEAILKYTYEICWDEPSTRDSELFLAVFGNKQLISSYFDTKLSQYRQDDSYLLAQLNGRAIYLLNSQYHPSIGFDQPMFFSSITSTFGFPDNHRFLQISDEFRNNNKHLHNAVKKGIISLKYASQAIRNNAEIVLPLVKKNPYELAYIGEDLRSNHGIFSAVLKQENKGFGHLLKYANSALQDNPEIVRLALENDIYSSNDYLENDDIAFGHVSERLRNDIQIVQLAVKNNGMALKFTTEAFRNNFQLVLSAVQSAGLVLSHASANLKNNPEIVLAAVEQDGDALQFVSEDFQRNHPEVVLAAVKQNGCALEFVSEDFQDNHAEIVLAAVEQSGDALQFVREDFQRNHPEAVLVAVKQDGDLLQFISAGFQRNHAEVVLAAVEQNGCALTFVSEDFQHNHAEVVLAAVEQNGFALKFVSEDFQSNHPEVVLAAVKQNGRALQFVSEDFQSNHPEVVLVAVKQSGDALAYVSKNLKRYDIVKTAVRSNGLALNYAGYELQNNHDIVWAAIEKCSFALTYASSEFKKNRNMIHHACALAHANHLKSIDSIDVSRGFMAFDGPSRIAIMDNLVLKNLELMHKV